MKPHEELLDILGEIDADLLPDPVPVTKPKRSSGGYSRRILRWTAAAAAVIFAAGGGVWFGRHMTPPLRTPEIVFASDIIPKYLHEVRREELLNDGSLLTVPRLTGISREPQIYSAATADEVVLPDSAPFTDRDGTIWRMYSINSVTNDSFEHNLRLDLIYLNYIRDYGCVLWQIDWSTEPSEVRYLGIVPVISREESLEKLLDGDYITSVPEAKQPAGGITESRIGRRTIVYLLSPSETFVTAFECFVVRLDGITDGQPCWGIYYVPVTDMEQAEKLAEKFTLD